MAETAQNYLAFLRTRTRQRTFFRSQKARLTFVENLQSVAHTQTQRTSNASPTPTLQVLKTLPAAPLVCSEACLQPTNRSSRVVGRHFGILCSLLKNQKATPVHENPRTVRVSKARRSPDRIAPSKADQRHGAFFFTREQPVSTPEADYFHS